jgi:hypothetical protein
MPFRWPAARGERATVVLLGLALIPLALVIASSAKEICTEGDVMWEGQGVTGVGQVPLLLRVLCRPKQGPFVAQYAPAPAPGSGDAPLWSELDARFQGVDGAREALEAFVWEA